MCATIGKASPSARAAKMAAINLTGQRFGRATVVERVASNRHWHTRWRMRCDCGTEFLADTSNLRRGRTQSCGCHRLGRPHERHGHAAGNGQPRSQHRGSPEYRVWRNMRDRCLNPNDTAYPEYGGRGIRICERWSSFQAFLADMGPRPSLRHSIEREDVHGNYEPGNCRWAIQKEQMRNTRRSRYVTYRGKIMTVSEAVERSGTPYGRAMYRLQHGWTGDAVFEHRPLKGKERRPC